MGQLKEWDNLAIKDLLATVKNQQNDTGRLHLCGNTKNATLPSLTNIDTYTGRHKGLKQATPSCQTGVSPRKGTWRGTIKATSVLSATFSLKCKALSFFSHFIFGHLQLWIYVFVRDFIYLRKNKRKHKWQREGGERSRSPPSGEPNVRSIPGPQLRLWPELKADA